MIANYYRAPNRPSKPKIYRSAVNLVTRCCYKDIMIDLLYLFIQT